MKLLFKYVTLFNFRYHQNGSKFQRNNFACHFKTDNLVIGSQRYKLHAIAMHQGTLESGHYTAACLNPKDNKYVNFTVILKTIKYQLFSGGTNSTIRWYV